MKPVAALVFAVVAGFASAGACEYCFLAEHGYVFGMNRTSIRVDTRYQYFDGLTGSPSTADQVQAYHLSTFVTLTYASRQWGLTLVAPYIHRSQVNTFAGSYSLHFFHGDRSATGVDPGSTERNSVGGIGDISVLGRYGLWVGESEIFSSLYVQGGFKFASGSITSRDQYGYLLHPHLQLGTGTGVVLFGATGSYGDFTKSISVGILVGSPLRSPHDFQEAASLNYDLTYQSRIVPDDAEDGPMLVGIAGFLGKVSGKERYRGVELDASGGHYMFFSGGFSFLPVPALKLDLLVNIPLIRALDGAQLEEQFRLVSGIQVIW